mgnify:CR=1 FL=1
MDHCAASDVLREELGIPIEGPHSADDFWISRLPEWCEMSGFPVAQAFIPDRWLEDGDTVNVGEQQLSVFHCPGHTPGHVVWRGNVDPGGRVGTESGAARARATPPIKKRVPAPWRGSAVGSRMARGKLISGSLAAH